MSPGEIASLAESDAVVMRIAFAGQPPHVSRMYWRGPTFGDFDGRVWRPVPLRAGPPPQPEVAPAHRSPARPMRYTATLEPSSNRWILALETATWPAGDRRAPDHDGAVVRR